jgi:hypothetical protein
VPIEHLLKARDGSGLIRERHRVIERVEIVRRERLAEICEGGLEAPDLHRERLEGDGGADGLVRVRLDLPGLEPQGQRQHSEADRKRSRNTSAMVHATLYATGEFVVNRELALG